MNSIRGRILALVLALFACSAVLIVAISVRNAAHEVEELFDARLAQGARMLLGLWTALGEARDGGAQIDAALAEALRHSGGISGADEGDGHPYEGKLAFQVWQGGVLVLRTGSAPAQALSTVAAGFADERVGEHDWRVFVLHDGGREVRIMVGERDDVRGELVTDIAWQTILPDLVGVPVLALMIWLAIGWGLRPLERMARQIRARGAHSLQPLALSALPEELAPMQQALNSLLGEVARLLASEQRFIADAAHELRTPLAVLRIHAHNALEAADEGERRAALVELRAGIERVAHLASQLLTLARLDAAVGGEVRQPVDLRAECRRELATLAPLAAAAGRELSLTAVEAGTWSVALEPGALGMLLHNLVGNALRHADGSVDVVLEEVAGGFAVRVRDHGRGLPEAQRNALTERFQRSGPAAGTGLGLSIVRRVAERHGGRLSLADTPGGGLTAEVFLPRS